jgi:AcrR family transcriptional regulator
MPKIVNTEEYKQELLEKSLDFFAQRGYEALTMRELAQGLGVSTGTLYHYFPSKALLFEQIVEQMCQEDINQAAAELGKEPTLKKKLVALAIPSPTREERRR